MCMYQCSNSHPLSYNDDGFYTNLESRLWLNRECCIYQAGFFVHYYVLIRDYSVLPKPQNTPHNWSSYNICVGNEAGSMVETVEALRWISFSALTEITTRLTAPTTSPASNIREEIRLWVFIEKQVGLWSATWYVSVTKSLQTCESSN